MAGIERADIGCWLDLFLHQIDDVGNTVDDHAYHTLADVKNNDNGEFIVGRIVQIEFDAHIDDGHYHPAQIDQPLMNSGALAIRVTAS